MHDCPARTRRSRVAAAAAEAEAGREASGMRCRCQRTSRTGRLRGLVETAEQRRLWTEMVAHEHARGAACHAGHQLRYRFGLAGRGRVRRSSAAPCGAGRLEGQGDASATSASRPRHEPLPARPAGTSRRPAFACARLRGTSRSGTGTVRSWWRLSSTCPATTAPACGPPTGNLQARAPGAVGGRDRGRRRSA